MGHDRRVRRQTLAAGRRHTVGIRADGMVLACGAGPRGAGGSGEPGGSGASTRSRRSGGECDVGGWTGVVAVAAGNVHAAANTGRSHTVGLRADGTVLATGWNGAGQCDVRSWGDVVGVAAG